MGLRCGHIRNLLAVLALATVLSRDGTVASDKTAN